jgi:hypothetical protein
MLTELKRSMQIVWRRRRMEAFLVLMHPKPRSRILDVGGLPDHLNGLPGMWELIKADLHITLLNLPGSFSRFKPHQLAPYAIIEADVCRLPESFANKFDIIFSNSVIEHVGSKRRQILFADFVRGAGVGYWVQTPSIVFPLEAHCDLPFWWCYPLHCKKALVRRWNKNGRPSLAKQMASTRPITARTLSRLFPGCSLFTETVAGIPKSIAAYGFQ